MAKSPSRRPMRPFADEEQWLRDFALFYGQGGITRFSEDDLNGVSLVKILEALARPAGIQCEKCDGPGTVCDIEAPVGDDEKILVTVHFISEEVKVEIRKAISVEEKRCEAPDAA